MGGGYQLARETILSLNVSKLSGKLSVLKLIVLTYFKVQEQTKYSSHDYTER